MRGAEMFIVSQMGFFLFLSCVHLDRHEKCRHGSLFMVVDWQFLLMTPLRSWWHWWQPNGIVSPLFWLSLDPKPKKLFMLSDIWHPPHHHHPPKNVWTENMQKYSVSTCSVIPCCYWLRKTFSDLPQNSDQSFAQIALCSSTECVFNVTAAHWANAVLLCGVGIMGLTDIVSPQVRCETVSMKREL